jgi:hypothetical protein
VREGGIMIEKENENRIRRECVYLYIERERETGRGGREG